MPIENLEEEGLEKNPNLDLAQKKFLLTTEEYRNDSKLKKELLTAIESDSEWWSLFSIRHCVRQALFMYFVESSEDLLMI